MKFGLPQERIPGANLQNKGVGLAGADEGVS